MNIVLDGKFLSPTAREGKEFDATITKLLQPLFGIIRLHRMHKMQVIITDVRGVRPSVCLSVTWLNSASVWKMAEQINMLFAVNTFGGLKNIALDGRS